MKDIRRKCNLMVDLSKFTFNKKILSKIVALSYDQFCNQILFVKKRKEKGKKEKRKRKINVSNQFIALSSTSCTG